MLDLVNVSWLDGRLTGVRAGNGPDVLLVHSLLADRTAFEPILPWLTAGHRVTLVNLPGFHGSQTIAPGIEGYADHVAAALEGLSRDTIVIGNGFGGTVAIALALQHGARFGRLVISDAAAGFPTEGAKAFDLMAGKVEAEGLGSIAEISAKRVFHPGYLAAHPEAIEQRRVVLMGIAPQAFVAACRTLVGTDLVPRLPEIKNPALVICGELDAATPPALCRQVAAGIPSATYKELAGCGHCPPLEQPGAFIAAAGPFID